MKDKKKEFTYKMVFFGMVGIVLTTLVLIIFEGII
jgi:hypothetical protein